MNRTQIQAAFVLVVVGLAFGAGVYSGVRHYQIEAATETNPAKEVDLASFWKAWSKLEEDFVSSGTTTLPTEDERIWGAIEGLVESYGDPYTVFLPPQKAEEFAEEISGSFSGVGMEIGVRDGTLTVVAPLKNTPAERAGILTGDKILAIDDTPSEKMPVDRAIQLIRGESGTVVTLTISRPGEAQSRKISVTRAAIEVPTINYFKRDDGVYVIELYNFSAISVERFRTALREFLRSGSKDLILDLRGNPGGYLEASVEIASYFLPVGETIVIEDFDGKEERDLHRSKGYNVFANRDLDMAVLINGGSASASEILAGALAEHDVATLIGETTFGKGSVQQLVNLGGGAELKITIARWLTPDGNSISNGGLKPEILVTRTAEDIKADRDPQIEAAAKYLLGR